MNPDASDAETSEEALSVDTLESQLDQLKQQLVGTLEQKEAEIERLEAELADEREHGVEQERFEQLQDDVEKLQENYLPIHAVETVLAKQGVSKETIDDVIEAARVVEDDAESTVTE